MDKNIYEDSLASTNRVLDYLRKMPEYQKMISLNAQNSASQIDEDTRAFMEMWQNYSRIKIQIMEALQTKNQEGPRR